MSLRRIAFVRRTALPLSYKGCLLNQTSEVELVVAARVAVHAKALTRIEPVHEADLLSQVRLGGWEQGLLLNFNTCRLQNGIRRVLNDG